MKTAIIAIAIILSALAIGGEKGIMVTQLRSWDIPTPDGTQRVKGTETNYTGIDGSGVFFRTGFSGWQEKQGLFHVVDLWYPDGKHVYVNYLEKGYDVTYDVPFSPIRPVTFENHCTGPLPRNPSKSDPVFIGYEDVMGVKAAHVKQRHGDYWYWEEAACITLKFTDGNSTIDPISISHVSDMPQFTTIPAEFKQMTAYQMRHQMFKRIYGDNYMNEVPACLKKTLSVPDDHQRYSEPLAVRQEKNKQAKDKN